MSRDDTPVLRLLIAGGGTGGHAFPALAIKHAVLHIRPHTRVIFVGTRRGFEYKLMHEEGETLRTLWISGFSRRHPLRNLLLPVKLVASLLQSAALLITFRPHAVVGTGGYVMGPVLFLAQVFRIPTILQEQNARPGITTRFLARRASCICVGFEESKRHLPHAKRIVVTGNPLRPAFRTVDRNAARQQWKLDPARRTLLVFGGSAGARRLNEVLSEILDELLRFCNIIWQTGRHGVPPSVDRNLLAAAHRSAHLSVVDFIKDMPAAYAVADLAVCRAGAMTLAELAAAAVPAILIPYPHATDDHQTANAESAVAAGSATLIPESELSGELLLATIRRYLNNEELLSAMRNAAQSLARPAAAENIARIILSLAGHTG